MIIGRRSLTGQLTRHSEKASRRASASSYVRVPDLYGQSLPDLIMVSERVTQDRHDHSAR